MLFLVMLLAGRSQRSDREESPFRDQALVENKVVKATGDWMHTAKKKKKGREEVE